MYFERLKALSGKQFIKDIFPDFIASKFIEVFNRKDAEDSRWLKEIEGASLIYFSGGNPKHLADTLRGTDLWEKIVNEFRTGSSLAGCSAGAMFMAQKIAFPIHLMHVIK